MKSITTIILSLIFSICSFSQIPIDPLESVSKQKLKEAKLMSEIIPNYPATEYNKTIDYISIEILATCAGKLSSSISKSDELTVEQKNILANADFSSNIGIDIKFKYKDSKNDNLGSSSKIKSMTYLVKVIN